MKINLLKKPIEMFLAHIDSISPEAHRETVKAINTGIITSSLNIPAPGSAQRLVCNINLNTGEITTGYEFLGSLWAVCWYLVAIERRIIKKECGATFTYWPLSESVIEDRLVLWALSLNQVSSKWPLELPNPLWDVPETETTNWMFTIAMTYLYFHELAHARYQHDPNGSDEEKVGMENEADRFARELVIGTSQPKHRQAITLGIAAAHIHMLLMSKTVVQQRHPDLDNRLAMFIGYVNMLDSNEFDDVAGMLCQGLLTACSLHGIQCSRTDFSSPRDQVAYLLGTLGTGKDSA